MKWLLRLVDRYTLWSSSFAWAEGVLTDKSLVSSWSSTVGRQVCVFLCEMVNTFTYTQCRLVLSIAAWLSGSLSDLERVNSFSLLILLSFQPSVVWELRRGEADGTSEFLVLLQLSWNWADLNWAGR